MDPHQLALLGNLPNQAFMNGGFQGKPELLIEMNMFWLKMLAKVRQNSLICAQLPSRTDRSLFQCAWQRMGFYCQLWR